MNNKLKIGIVCYPTYGGSGVVATELGIALAAKGHQVHFISYSKPFRLDLNSENLFFHQVNVPDYPLFEYAPYELNLTSKLVDVSLHQGLDLLHVHYAIPHASAALSAKQILHARNIKLPIITTLHGTDITLLGKDKSFKPVIEFAINQSDAVTAVSENLKHETIQNFNIRRRIEMIPNFIDLNLYTKLEDEKIRNQYIKEDEFIISHISNFRRVKRIEDVISIFSRVNRKVNAKLLMIGDGPDRQAAEKMTAELNVQDKVFFLGKIKNTQPYLAISDIFLLPSETESFGLVALEAMASRVAVISTNSGGLNEVNMNGVTGYLSGVGAVDEMADRAIDLLSNPQLLRNFKNQARQHAMNFDLGSILPKYEQLYRRFSN